MTMKKLRLWMLPGLTVLLALGLMGCGTGERAPSAPPPTETSAPATPEPAPPPTEYTVTGESAEEILALAEIPTLRLVDGEQSEHYEALFALQERLPDCEVRWRVPFQGQMLPGDTEELTVTDLAGLEELLPWLPKLQTVDLLSAGATLEDLDRFDALRPDVFWLWEFPFRGFTVRTDIQCYSTLQDIGFTRSDGESFYPLLHYCRKLKALDLGHNDIVDVTDIGRMEDLEVLILADNPIVDASPLGNLKKLHYLELFLCRDIEDWSFLRELTEIEDLNLCYCESCPSLDFLEVMPKLRFGMFKFMGIPYSEFHAWQERLPEAVLVYDNEDRESCNDGWRDTHRNYQIRFSFTNWPNVVDYRRYDDVLFDFDGYEMNIGDY